MRRRANNHGDNLMGIESKIEADLRARAAEDDFPLVDEIDAAPVDVPERGKVTWEVWAIALIVGATAVNAVVALVQSSS